MSLLELISVDASDEVRRRTEDARRSVTRRLDVELVGDDGQLRRRGRGAAVGPIRQQGLLQLDGRAQARDPGPQYGNARRCLGTGRRGRHGCGHRTAVNDGGGASWRTAFTDGPGVIQLLFNTTTFERDDTI